MMKFKLLAFAVVSVVALAMTQEERYEVETRAVYDHVNVDSGRVAAAFWPTGADTFLVVHDYSNAKGRVLLGVYQMPPKENNSIWRTYQFFSGEYSGFVTAEFSRDGSHVAIRGAVSEPTVTVFDVGTGEVLYQTHVDSLNTHTRGIGGAALSPSGDTLLLPDRDGIVGVNLVTGREFLIDIKPDTIGYYPYFISSDGRFINGVGTKNLTPEFESIDVSRWFIHDLVTGRTEFYVIPGETPGSKVFFPPEPGIYYEIGYGDTTFVVMRKRTLPDREVLDEWPLAKVPSGVTFSSSGDWMIASTENTVLGNVSYIYHRDPYYLAGVVADSVNETLPRGTRTLATYTAMFSPDDKWIVGADARGDLTLYEVEKNLLSVDESRTEDGVLNLKLFPNVVRRGSDVYLGSTSDFMATILIVDVAGRIISEEHREVRRSGTAIFRGDAYPLSPGRYFVVVRNDRGKSANLSLIVQ